MSSAATFEIFQDNAGEWRWRLIASNGKIIADSGEGYQSKQGVKRGIESVKKSAAKAQVQILDNLWISVSTSMRGRLLISSQLFYITE